MKKLKLKYNSVFKVAENKMKEKIFLNLIMIFIQISNFEFEYIILLSLFTLMCMFRKFLIHLFPSYNFYFLNFHTDHIFFRFIRLSLVLHGQDVITDKAENLS